MQSIATAAQSRNVYPVAFPIPTRRLGISTRSDWVAPTAFWKRPSKDVPHVRVENDFWKEGIAAKIGPVAQAVLFYLRSKADVYVQCWPEVPTIAEQIGSSESNVKRALKVLEKFGLIVKAPCFYEGTLKSTSNLYVLCPLASFREPGQPEPSRVQIEPTKPRVEGSNRTANKEPSTFEEGRIEEGGTNTARENPREPEPPACVSVPSSSSLPTKHEAKEVQQAGPLSEKSTSTSPLYDALLAEGVLPYAARALLRDYSAEDITAQLEYLPARLEAQEENGLPVENPGAYLAKSIRKNWLPPGAWLDELKAQEAQEAAQREREAQSRAQAMKAAQNAAVRQERVSAQEETARLDAEWEALAPSEQRELDGQARMRLGVLGRAGNCDGALAAMRRTLLRERLQGTARAGYNHAMPQPSAIELRVAEAEEGQWV